MVLMVALFLECYYYYNFELQQVDSSHSLVFFSFNVLSSSSCFGFAFLEHYIPLIRYSGRP